MNFAIVIGRKGSQGFPGKNTIELLGRPAVEYPLIAALGCQSIDSVFVSTDCENIKACAIKHKVEIIERPASLCGPEVSPGKVFQDALFYAERQFEAKANLIILLYANAVNVLPEYIQGCINLLDSQTEIDSAATIAELNMFNPLRARRILPNGENVIFSELKEQPINPESIHDRATLGSCYFMTAGAQVVRRETLIDQTNGYPPYPWLGKRIGTFTHEIGFDIDSPWQVPVAEYWLRKNGFTDQIIPFTLRELR
jgi:CMP-N-acetylneuraminic acid synthetase